MPPSIHSSSRQLGYLASSAHSVFPISRNSASTNSVPVVMADVKCSGDENSLVTCNNNLNSRCLGSMSRSVVGLRCSLKPPTHAQVRLVSSPTALRGRKSGAVVEGRLEIYVGQQWGTVCDRQFDIRLGNLKPFCPPQSALFHTLCAYAPPHTHIPVRSEAQVVCRQLGYEVADTRAYFTSGGNGGGLRILANDLQCAGARSTLANIDSRPLASVRQLLHSHPPPPYHGTGSETSLQQCKGRFNSPRQRCSHADDVGVRCTLPRISSPQSKSALEDLPQYGDYIASGSELKLRDGYVQTTLGDCKQRCASMPLCKVSSSVFFSASQPDITEATMSP